MNEIPDERTDSATRLFVRKCETRAATWVLRLSPVWFVLTWVVAAIYGKYLLFLQPAEDWSGLISSRIGLLAGACAVGLSIVWWLSLKVQPNDPAKYSGLVSALLAITIVAAASAVVAQPRGRFVLQEAVKSRAPELDFVRNIVFQQQALAGPQSQPVAGRQRIGLIGSSQIMLGIDADQLSQQTNGSAVQRAAMPGMVPLQYLALAERFSDQRLTHVVCWLSEFDFFREQTIPTVRLRWCSDVTNWPQIVSVLSPRQRLRDRGSLADLGFAACVPLWQQRSVIQKGWLRLWWPYDVDVAEIDEDERAIGGRLVAKGQGVKNAQRNIKRTPLLQANFAAFEKFAEIVVAGGTELIVIEGESHPETMAAYPAKFRSETRDTLQSMAERNGFIYITAEQRPTFGADDWRDAVHLNEHGRAKLTKFVAQYITND